MCDTEKNTLSKAKLIQSNKVIS